MSNQSEPPTSTPTTPLTIIDPPPPPKGDGATTTEAPKSGEAAAAAPPVSGDKPAETVPVVAPQPPPQVAPVQTPAASQAIGTSMVVAPPKELGFMATSATDASRLAKMLASSNFVKGNGINSEADVAYLIMWGRQWNLPTIACLQVHIIKGKPTLPADTIVGIIKASPLCYEFELIETSLTKATYVTRRVRKDGTIGKEITLSYTIEEAEQMGLVSKGRTQEAAGRNQWHTQPGVMLRKRAAVALARIVYPDLMLGLHSQEEMIDAIDIGGPDIEAIKVSRAEVEAARANDPLDLALVVDEPQYDQDGRDYGGPPPAPSSPPPRQQSKGLGGRLGQKAEQLRRDSGPVDETPRCPGCKRPGTGPALCRDCR